MIIHISQWLPKTIKWQWIYLVFRWAVLAYFLGWLVPSGLIDENGGPKYFIFLTNWCYLMWNSYLIVSALTTTFKVIQNYCCRGQSSETSTRALLDKPKPYIDIDKPIGCCGRKNDATSWYNKVQWVLFYLGAEMAVAVCILYWAAIYGGGTIDGVNANTHLVNCVIGVIDIVFSGIPVRLLHFIYAIAFYALYTMFTGIYYAADGTNAQGDPYIYSVIDYGNSPGSASGWVLGIVIVFIPVVHLLVYGLYSARFWLTYWVWSRVEAGQGGQLRTEEGEGVDNLTLHSDDKV